MILLPISLLNPVMWKTILIDFTGDLWTSKAWRHMNVRPHTVLLQIVAINIARVFLLLLLVFEICTIVNIPYLLATVYHLNRDLENEFIDNDRDMKCCNECFAPKIYRNTY